MPYLHIFLCLFVILFALFWLFRHTCRWYESFEHLEFIDIPPIQKKSNVLILHYGNVNLDLTNLSENVQSYADKYKYDYWNSSDTNVWKTVNTLFEKFKYEYICILPARVYVHNKNRSLDHLIEEAGDASMILARDEMDEKNVNLDVIIFRDCEWTRYKLHQFFFKEEENEGGKVPVDIVLDQVYTNYLHKNFTEFSEFVTMGIPYMLTNICVYNEHALASSQSDFLRYHNRTSPKKNSTTLVYPWNSIKHPRFTLVKSDDIWNIQPTKDRIPKIIFQTMESHLIMVNIRSCIDQLQTLNPGYKYYYFTSQDCRKFIQKFYPEVLNAYDSLLPGAYKADLWRYCVLHKYGGFYMDARMYPYLSFDSVITKDTEFMSCIDCTPHMLYQAILAVTPNSSYMRNAIDECIENIETRNYKIGDLAVTGPRVMGRALNKVLKRPLNKDLNDIEDRRIVLLRWNSPKAPKYLMNLDEIFACHKYTKLLTDKEVHDETEHWLILTGKEHYSSSFRNNRVFKDKLFQENNNK